MRFNILCFSAGVWLLQQQAELPGVNGLWLLCSAACLGCAPPGPGWEGRVARALLVKCLCVGLGFYWAAGWAHLRLGNALPIEWEGRDIVVSGVIASLPLIHERGTRFVFDVEAVHTPGAAVPSRVSLAWWGSAAREGLPATLPEVRAGQRWQLTVRLRRPRGTANPHGFDYEAWLLERGLRATGYVRPRGLNRMVAPMVQRPAYWVERARGAIRDRILRVLSGAPSGGVIVALAIGEQRAITHDQWRVFTRTGINHLMSISGLHVTMISGLVFAVACWLWRRSARLVQLLPASKVAAAAGLGAAYAYALLSGFAVPAQRTLYMLGVAAAALWLGRSGSVSHVLAAALLVVLLLDPWAVLAPGFWLSFGAVAVIMYVTVGRMAWPSWIANWARVQWAVTLVLVPPLIAMFQQVSVVSPLANALAIPLVSLVVVPLTLSGAVLPLDFLLHMAHWVMAACLAVLVWMNELPVAVWQQHAPPAWTVLAAMVGIAWMLLPRGFPARWVGIAGLLPMFLLRPPQPAAGDLVLTVLDVGHGLAVVARTRGHALLYDAGPAFGPGADSGNRIIVPYLRATGVRQLDGMVVSHDDSDHRGGALSVLQALPVRELITSVRDGDTLLTDTGAARRCHAGQRWEWDGVRFDVLHPQDASYADARIRDNDRSCVLRITAPGGTVLVPGDVERRSEAALIAAYGAGLAADVLVVPHQGSRSSSTPEFVSAVAPRVAVIPLGYRNRFGHPHPAVVARYRALGSRIYRTDRDGALTVTLEAGGRLYVEARRAVYRRYWQLPFAGDAVPEPDVIAVGGEL